MDEASVNPYRLPRDVVPRRYELRLEPDLEAFTFAGAVAVDVEVQEQVGEIVLNAAELEISGGHLDGVALAGVEYDDEHERAVLRLGAPASPGPARLHLSFSGLLNDQLRGFYRSTFTDGDGQERVIATTQFESTNARRAFPCWDEPDLKATFEVTLVVPDGLMAVSSGAEIDSRPTGDGRREGSFAPTMEMSTYLLAFVVGPLEATEPVEVNGTPLRIVHPIGKGHLTEYALDVGSFCLRFFEAYFAIDYPGDKLDLVAIPDFAFGAMENMGCVTFREILLLVDPDSSTQQERQTAADVIAHELAHMWFGNLVTMKWWNGIWLKEAFATFCEMLAVDAYRPDWKRWLAFGLSRAAAFDVDALAATRAVEYPVVSPADAEGMYDLLTYEKGAAAVRMLEQYLGAEAFRDGVRSYLRRHSYANTETHDLWDALARSAGEPVRDVMESWISQSGHPVVTAAEGDSGAITLSQERFRYDQQSDDARWHVPVVAAVGGDAEARTERLVLQAPVALDARRPDWVMVNPTADGFYRVAYEGGLLNRLLEGGPDLDPLQRYVLVDDQWALTVGGRLSVGHYLAFAERIAACEDDLAVWRRLAGTLGAVDHMAADGGRAGLRARVSAMAGPALSRVGWMPVNGEDDRIGELRGVLVRTLAIGGNDGGAIARCRELMATDDADAALAAAAVAVVAATGDEADYEEIRQRYERAPTPQLELRYLMALTAFDHSDLMDLTLACAIDGTVRSQDAGSVLRGCLENRDHGPRAWAFITEHWDDINQRLP
ncbi:MAG: M1 family metallopeptidase, partial [bacterium]|nr:M1 family metallopeptidase [bacterium]